MMTPNESQGSSRRDFLKTTGRVAAVSALAGVAIPSVHAAEDNTIRVALIGCGSRGTGAAADAMSVKNGPVKVVALADAFQDKVNTSYDALKKNFNDQLDVPDDRKFVGLDAYKKAMDCLKPGDIAISATPLAFRELHFDYAIKKGINIFMEKPVTADGPTSRRMLKLAETSVAKNQKVGIGLMSRHSRPFAELADRIHNGEIGDLLLLRAYRMHGPIVGFNTAKPKDMTEVEFQIRKFHTFLWGSGGIFSDYYIHIIDHCCWMKNAWPVMAQAIGGRQYRENADGVTFIDQNFDTYGVEYTFEDGTKLFMDGRAILGCQEIYHSFAHGTKGSAVISKSGDIGMPSSIYKNQLPKKSDRLWESKVEQSEQNPYVNEWNDLVDAIRADKPYNEAKRGIEASIVTSMGRMAAHIGREVSYDEMLNCPHEFAPNLAQLTLNGPAPVPPDANGRYPIPQPGILTDREY